MENPKVSVIVPIYNAEKYLHRCVDSLLNQTFSDFEILLIDDGSPDNSGIISDEYAQKDTRVRVIHKKNGGVSSARQCGIDNALGEDVIHADPDDWVESRMLEDLYNKAIEEDADLVICDFFIDYADKMVYQKQRPMSTDHEGVLKELFQHLHASCWNKLIRRACIQDTGICFDPELSFCEDLYYHSSLLMHDIAIAYLPKAYYHYDQAINGDSIVRKYKIETYEYDLMLYDKVVKLLVNTSAYDSARANMGYLLVLRAFFGNVFNSKEFKSKFYSYRGCIKEKLRMRKTNVLLCYMLYFSCLGMYHFMFGAYTMVKKLVK